MKTMPTMWPYFSPVAYEKLCAYVVILNTVVI